MVTKTVAAPPVAFPEAPPRVDMQNFLQLHQPALLPALRARLREIEDRKPTDQRRSVFVFGDIPVRPLPTLDYTRLFVPDLTVGFDVDMETFERDYGYAIEHQGKPPKPARANSKRSSDACKGESRARKAAFFPNLIPCAKLEPSP